MAISTMARLVEIAIVGPAVERGEALLPGIRAAAAVGGTIRARAVPRHADEEGAVMSVVGRPPRLAVGHQRGQRSEEHTSELQSLMRISYAVFCLKKNIQTQIISKRLLKALSTNEPH